MNEPLTALQPEEHARRLSGPDSLAKEQPPYLRLGSSGPPVTQGQMPIERGQMPIERPIRIRARAMPPLVVETGGNDGGQNTYQTREPTDEQLARIAQQLNGYVDIGTPGLLRSMLAVFLTESDAERFLSEQGVLTTLDALKALADSFNREAQSLSG